MPVNPTIIDREAFLLSDSVYPIVTILIVCVAIAVTCYIGYRSERLQRRGTQIWLRAGFAVWVLDTVYLVLLLRREMYWARDVFESGVASETASNSLIARAFSIGGSALFWLSIGWISWGFALAVLWFIRSLRAGASKSTHFR